MRGIIGGAVGCVLAGAAAQPAKASAWTRPKGDIFVIGGYVYDAAPQAFTADGDRVSSDRFRKQEIELYTEYGLTSRVTLFGKLRGQYLDAVIGGEAVETAGLGETEMGARLRLAKGDRWVVSVQGTAVAPGTVIAQGNVRLSSGHPDGEVRALFGHSFRFFGLESFGDLQAGYRYRAGEPGNEYRLDATLGTNLTPRLSWLVQSFNIQTDGTARAPFLNFRQHKVQSSAVIRLSGTTRLEIGGFTTPAGRNVIAESGAKLAVWLSF